VTIQQRMDVATGRALERHLIAEAEAEADERRYRKLTAHRELVQWAEDRAKKRLALVQLGRPPLTESQRRELHGEDK